MMRTRLFVLLCVVCVGLLVLLAACGGGGSDASAAATGTAAAPTLTHAAYELHEQLRALTATAEGMQR